MESENVAIVKRGLEAYNAGDLERVIEGADPEIEFVPLRSLLVGGSYRGHDGIKRFIADVRDEWEELRIELDDIREHGDQVVLLGQFQGRGKASGVEMRSPVAWVFRLRGGKIVRMQAYSDRAEALSAVGLET